MGRIPYKYKGKDTIAEAEAYLAQCVDEQKGVLVTVRLPSIEGLAVYLNINRDTAYFWKKKHEAFRVILDKLLAMQAPNDQSKLVRPQVRQRT